jgi:hypothetical protein
MSGVGKPSNPFVGPEPFMFGQTLYGRGWETRMLFNLLLSKRLVLLHSASGAGKTSLIQAGLWPRLETKFRARPLIRLNAVSGATSTSSNRYVYSTLRSLEPSSPMDASIRTLSEYRSGGDKAKPELWIFDQFEEVLSLDPIDDREKRVFFEQLAEALVHTKGPRWALFAMREDYLGAMQPYLKLLPTGLSVRFRLELLDSGAARQAIQKPASGTGVGFTDAAARRLVDDLRRVRVDRPGGPEPALGPYIEPVQLQVVCRQLWEELPPMTTSISEEYIEASGDVDRALSRYYDTQVRKVVDKTGISEVLLRDWFDHELITERGFRNQTRRGPGAGGKRTDHALQLLTDAHIIRSEPRHDVPWYELAHDRLLEPLQRSNRTWRQQHSDVLAEGEDRDGRSVREVPPVRRLARAARGVMRWARWTSFLIGSWLRKRSVSLLMNGIVAGVLLLAWWLAWPPSESWSGGHLAMAVLAVWFLSLLPGWLYISFLRERVPSLWDEYVLNLHRLAWDLPRYLPKPPVNSAFFTEWSNDGGDLLIDQPNLYQQKFDANFGKSVSESSHRQGSPIRTETFFPVFLITATFAVCWTAVLWDPSFVSEPAGVWDSLKFGFLGAYAFTVQMLVRRYSQSSLGSSAYASAMVRIIIVLLLVVVLQQLLPVDPRTEAVVAFLVGVFPPIVVQVLQRATAAMLRVFVPQLTPNYPLDQLDGLNVWYEARLMEDGIENMQNLANANLVDVILHTRVPVGRLVDWVDQAHLYLHMDRIERGWGERTLRRAHPDGVGKPDGIVHGSVTDRSRTGTRTRVALRQLGISTATELLTAFPPEHVDPNSVHEPDTLTQERLTALREVGLDPTQILTMAMLLNKSKTLAPVWNWKNRWAGPSKGGASGRAAAGHNSTISRL